MEEVFNLFSFVPHRRKSFFEFSNRIFRSTALLEASLRIAASVAAPWQPGPRPR